MKKLIISIVILLIKINVSAQPPVISYMIPDIGAPGLSTYIEIIGPFNPDNPSASLQNFGSDGFKVNNTASTFKVRCFNPADEWKLTFSPCIVSWDGRMVSLQVFVNSKLTPNSSDWQALTSEFRIPIVVETSSGVVSNVETFYIVQPWNLGNVSALADRSLGQGALGKRSRRGAMIVNSLTLANSTYSVSVNDCDPLTGGNQGYLPFILMSPDRITGSANTIISVSGEITNNGHGGNGGPGGGGGGGRFCDVKDEGDDGGSGFVSGGAGGRNRSGVPLMSDKIDNYGLGTGNNGNSINGILPPEKVGYEAAAGGTGHPFGKSGISVIDGNSGNNDGGFGGASGYRQNTKGGSGGYATRGLNSSSGSICGGKIHGNEAVVPIAGGSGGSSGNPNSLNSCSGSGGGGGGAINIYSPFINNIALYANGGNGNNGDNGATTRGGSGSGGFTGITSKLPLNNLTLHVEGGRDQDNDLAGGAGRMRFDLPSWTGDNTNFPANASKFRGPTTDTTQFVKRKFTVTGSRGDDKTLYFYLKPESSDWRQVSGEVYNGNAWQLDFDLTGTTFCNDSIFYFVVYQEVPNPVKDIALHVFDPDYVTSQASTNIFRIIPDIQGDTQADIRFTVCDRTESDTVKFEIRNEGGPSLNLDMANAYFDAQPNGTKFNGFEIIDPVPSGSISLSSCESQTFTVVYTYQPGHPGFVNSKLFIPHNDLDITRKNPWEVDFNVILDTFALFCNEADLELNQINVLVMDSICIGDSIKTNFKIKNISNFDVTISDFVFSNDADKFSGSVFSPDIIVPGGETNAFIAFNNPQNIQQYRTRVYLRPNECQFAVDSFDVVVDIIENQFNYSQNLVVIDTIHFGKVKVGYSKTASTDFTNDGTGQAFITTVPVFTPFGQTEFDFDGALPNLPALLNSNTGSKLILNLKFTPSAEGPFSATLTVNSDDSESPISCPGTKSVILFGEGIRSEMTAYPVDFGLIANCEGLKRDTVKVKNTGSAPVNVITAPEILGNDKIYFKLINPKQPTFSLAQGDSIIYIIEFDPSIPLTGQKSATFHLRTDDNFEPDVYAEIQAETDIINLIAVPDLLSYGGVPVPEKKSDIVTVSNNGRFDVLIDKVDVVKVADGTPEPLISFNPDIAGQTILNGDSRVLNIEVDFREFRQIDAWLRVIYSEPCLDTILVRISGQGLEGEYTFRDFIDFGDIPFCQTSSNTFTLTNLGDPTVEIRKMELLPLADYQFFTLTPPEPNGIVLQRDEEYFREILFHPDKTTDGNKEAFLQTIVFVNGKEDTLSTRLFGTRKSGLLATPGVMNFGKVIKGTNKNLTLTLKNEGTNNITINSFQLIFNIPGIFTIIPDQFLVPKTLIPGDTVQFQVTFHPLDTISYLDSLEFSIITPCDEVRKIILIGTGRPALNARIWLPKITIDPTELIQLIPIYMKLDEPGNSITGMSFETTIKFNSSIFLPGAVSDDAKIIDRFKDNDDNWIISIKGENLNISDNDSILFELIGTPLLGYTESSPLEFINSLILPDTIFAPINYENGEIKLKICKEGQPRLLIQGKPTMLLANPNPAGSSLNISGHALEKGTHYIEIIDIQGNIKIVNSWETNGNEPFDFNFNLSEFSSGMYYIKLVTPERVKAIPVFIVN